MNINKTVSRGQVIERIRAVYGQTKLLVVAAEAGRYFHKHRVRLSSRLPFVTVCPSMPPGDYDQLRRRHGIRPVVKVKNDREPCHC